MSEMTDQTTRASPVGDALRSEIKRRGLTAYRIAEDAGVSVDAVQRFLKGQRGLNLATIDAIAAHLGLALVSVKPTNPA
jgi:transcriptional regulator with XRE-family HTH domain